MLHVPKDSTTKETQVISICCDIGTPSMTFNLKHKSNSTPLCQFKLQCLGLSERILWDDTLTVQQSRARSVLGMQSINDLGSVWVPCRQRLRPLPGCPFLNVIHEVHTSVLVDPLLPPAETKQMSEQEKRINQRGIIHNVFRVSTKRAVWPGRGGGCH